MSPNAPDHDLDQMEQAQAALRDGIERARKLVRDAQLTMRAPKIARSEPPAIRASGAPTG